MDDGVPYSEDLDEEAEFDVDSNASDAYVDGEILGVPHPSDVVSVDSIFEYSKPYCKV